jgi:hypothetical protein
MLYMYDFFFFLKKYMYLINFTYHVPETFLLCKTWRVTFFVVLPDRLCQLELNPVVYLFILLLVFG